MIPPFSHFVNKFLQGNQKNNTIHVSLCLYCTKVLAQCKPAPVPVSTLLQVLCFRNFAVIEVQQETQYAVGAMASKLSLDKIASL